MIFYKQKGLRMDILTWTGLRLSVPKVLRSCELLPEVDLLDFQRNNIQFDVSARKLTKLEQHDVSTTSYHHCQMN